MTNTPPARRELMQDTLDAFFHTQRVRMARRLQLRQRQRKMLDRGDSMDCPGLVKDPFDLDCRK